MLQSYSVAGSLSIFIVERIKERNLIGLHSMRIIISANGGRIGLHLY